MDPLPGELLVEFEKDGNSEPGLDVHHRDGHAKTRIYFSKATGTEKIHVGDRLIAVNGKSVESLGYDLGKIREELSRKGGVQVRVDPTMIKK